uniref:Pectate lyase n=2 Tax=Kalanchoe fedtschenkoi TaxID=63787 RepID=A0A7N0VF12_KALFE
MEVLNKGEGVRWGLVLVLCFVFAVLVPRLEADIAVFDDVWKQRAEQAHNASKEAYDPNPDVVTDNFNSHVHKAVEGANSTRRNLKKTGGGCVATNPIDRCWRCQKDWMQNRKRLAGCALGFGRKAIGGKNGKFYTVTDSSDDDMVNPKPGTLRHAVIQPGPLWIIFARDMVIRLSEELIMTSDKTIDARGANVYIVEGAGITIQFIKNVIIHGLHIRDIVASNGGLIRDSADHYGLRTRADGDGISIYGSSDIWVDHVSMSNCQDGLIDIIMASTAITISNGHFTHHNDVMLFGASDSYSGDSVMQVTVAFNHFGQGLVQRMPRARWGFIHVVNNDYTHWLMYAIGGSQHPTIISQGNRFIAPPNEAAKEVTKRDYAPESEWKTWTWRSEEDLMMNGAFFVQSGGPLKSQADDVIPAKPGSYVTRLTRYSGALSCKANQPC